MLGYIFTTETEAMMARNQAAIHKGLPNAQGDTLYWVNYNFSSIENVYYIQHVEGLEAVLGEPSEITITLPIPI